MLAFSATHNQRQAANSGRGAARMRYREPKNFEELRRADFDWDASMPDQPSDFALVPVLYLLTDGADDAKLLKLTSASTWFGLQLVCGRVRRRGRLGAVGGR
jgi:hypothetical protein